jgi:hypothetical protein
MIGADFLGGANVDRRNSSSRFLISLSSCPGSKSARLKTTRSSELRHPNDNLFGLSTAQKASAFAPVNLERNQGGEPTLANCPVPERR